MKLAEMTLEEKREYNRVTVARCRARKKAREIEEKRKTFSMPEDYRIVENVLLMTGLFQGVEEAVILIKQFDYDNATAEEISEFDEHINRIVRI